MDNGSWIGLFVPIPFLFLLLAVMVPVLLFGGLFVMNQIVGILISGVVEHVRGRRPATVEVSEPGEVEVKP